MMQPLALTEPLYAYLMSHVEEHSVLLRCREETSKLPDHRKQIPPEQGQFFAFLLKLIRPYNVLELGTFSGYSALVFALNTPDTAQVITCDINKPYLNIAARYFEEAGVLHKIDMRLMKANDCLDLLLASGRDETFDFIFIDADKPNLQIYYEKALSLISQKGLIVIDNVLWHGNVVDPTMDDKNTQAIRLFNDTLRQDKRVMVSMLPIGDGVSLIQKRDVA